MLLKHKNVSSLPQIKDNRLHFRYNLNSLRTEEKDIWLSAITVGDGQWHTAKVRKLCVSYTINNSFVE
jgi:Laminin G domain.